MRIFSCLLGMFNYRATILIFAKVPPYGAVDWAITFVINRSGIKKFSKTSVDGRFILTFALK